MNMLFQTITILLVFVGSICFLDQEYFVEYEKAKSSSLPRNLIDAIMSFQQRIFSANRSKLLLRGCSYNSLIIDQINLHCSRYPSSTFIYKKNIEA